MGSYCSGNTPVYIRTISFSEPDSRMIVAPYWSDSDIRLGRESGEEKSLNQIFMQEPGKKSEQHLIVTHMDFEPTWLFIAAWDHSVYYQDGFFSIFTRQDLNKVREFHN